MTSFVLLQSGDRLLLQSGGKLVAEDHVAIVAGTAQFASRRFGRRFDSAGPRRQP